MKKKIVFDLDGVFRELLTYLKDKYGIPYPNSWSWTFKGKGIYWWAKKDKKQILEFSPVSEYLEIVKKYYKCLEIWTWQPLEWRKGTRKWLNKYIKNYKVRYLTTEQKEKRLNSLDNVLLLEDNPNFINYDKIILVDRPYNRHIKAKCRVKNTKQLEKILKENV